MFLCYLQITNAHFMAKVHVSAKRVHMALRFLQVNKSRENLLLLAVRYTVLLTISYFILYILLHSFQLYNVTIQNGAALY